MKSRVFLSTLLVALCAVPFGTRAQDDRPADRAAIKAHIESIFQAFIEKDFAKLRATHAENWLGYLDGKPSAIKGIEAYMDWNQLDPKSPYGMKSYKFREFDVIFKGDAAFVCFITDTELITPNGPFHRALRISDFYTKTDDKWIQSGSYTAPDEESVEAELAAPHQIDDGMKKRLLAAREAVWRAYFAGDRAMLEKLIPQELIAIEPGGDSKWSGRNAILEGATEFARRGKLTKLEFPRTEIQMYGMTAVIYSIYSYELEVGGERSRHSGRVTEVFVLRNGEWVNPGWHMDSAGSEQ